jgi:hypothetical protein
MWCLRWFPLSVPTQFGHLERAGLYPIASLSLDTGNRSSFFFSESK